MAHDDQEEWRVTARGGQTDRLTRFSSFTFSRTSSSVLLRNPATSAKDIPCSSACIEKKRSVRDHGSPDELGGMLPADA
jgi:hypothetical protein